MTQTAHPGHARPAGLSRQSPRTPAAGTRAGGLSAYRPAAGFAVARRGRYGNAVMWQLLREFLLFLREEKKWWLVPLVLALLLLAALILFGAQSPGLAPFLYPLM